MIIISKNRLTKNKWEIQFHAVNIPCFFAKILGSRRETTTKGEEMHAWTSCHPRPLLDESICPSGDVESFYAYKIPEREDLFF